MRSKIIDALKRLTDARLDHDLLPGAALIEWEDMRKDLAVLRAENERLHARLSALDCRYAGGGLADMTGSHCPIERPCQRCANERLKTLLKNLLAFNDLAFRGIPEWKSADVRREARAALEVKP